MRRKSLYIYERPDWPKFRWDSAAPTPAPSACRLRDISMSVAPASLAETLAKARLDLGPGGPPAAYFRPGLTTMSPATFRLPAVTSMR
jgi:hypothetical protein